MGGSQSPPRRLHVEEERGRRVRIRERRVCTGAAAGGMGAHGPRDAGGLQTLDALRKRTLPWSLRRRLCPSDPLQTSGLQNPENKSG